MGVDPEGAGALAVVVDIVGGEVSGGDDAVVAVDGDGYEGQNRALTGHERPFHTVHDDGGNVHLTVGDGKADGAAVDLTVLGGDRQGVVEKLRSLSQSKNAALRGGEAAAQAQRAGLVELCGGKGAAEGGDVIAQQLEHGGAGLLEGHSVVGAEAAVQIAAEPALLDYHSDVGAIGRGSVHIGKQGAGAALCSHILPVGGKGRQQPGKLAPGKGSIGVGGLLGGHAAQSHSGLHGGVGASRRRRHHQQGC